MYTINASRISFITPPDYLTTEQMNLFSRFLPNWKAQTEFSEILIEKTRKRKIKELIEHQKSFNRIKKDRMKKA